VRSLAEHNSRSYTHETMTRARTTPPAELRHRAEEVLRHDRESARLLLLLRRLASCSSEGSEDAVFAHRHLAELLLDRDPWRASLHARALLKARPEDDRGWAALGLAQAELGHPRFAVHAFEHAVRLSPANPWYAHNLGVLLDAALDDPERAIPWLARAAERHRTRTFLAALAHALRRAGKKSDANALTLPEPKRRRIDAAALRVLERGLASLPFDAALRREAKRIARVEIDKHPPDDEEDARCLAAAVAFAVARRAALPLGASEVAACYRVRTERMRRRLRMMPR
jgi:Flp pilus assembly protein TadD